MWERIARFILPLLPIEILFAADRVNLFADARSAVTRQLALLASGRRL
jgi:hypothetical protein